mmetsp:Transcript_50048/g.117874  ORF Transcript_50048/g.117874 Transcript_50048/m.117874 type:complete len:212 (+) Transcript_50048:614-1249(+)
MRKDPGGWRDQGQPVRVHLLRQLHPPRRRLRLGPHRDHGSARGGSEGGAPRRRGCAARAWCQRRRHDGQGQHAAHVRVGRRTHRVLRRAARLPREPLGALRGGLRHAAPQGCQGGASGGCAHPAQEGRGRQRREHRRPHAPAARRAQQAPRDCGVAGRGPGGRRGGGDGCGDRGQEGSGAGCGRAEAVRRQELRGAHGYEADRRAGRAEPG